MKALVIVAHGSKRESSNTEVLRLIEALKVGLEYEYAITVTAFLEFASPSIPAALAQCVEQGATEIKVLPYFLAAGKHVNDDIPEQAHLSSNGQAVKIDILPHLGSSSKILDVMRGMALMA